MNSNVRNILKVYDNATKDEINEGLTWYARANAEARCIADNGVSWRRACAVVAAVSPGMKWERNIECANRIIQCKCKDKSGCECLAGLGVRWYDGVHKARKIVTGDKPLRVLKGNKVRAFYRCMINPKDDKSVCIDGHAYSIWAGRRLLTSNSGSRDENVVPNITDKMYERIAADYREAADVVGILPQQIQAIVWVVWRRMIRLNGQLPLF